jgi:carboxypeptidase Taq
MHTTKKSFKQLLEYYKEISLLNNIQAQLEWDLNTYLPPSAAQERSEQTSYITKLSTEKWQDPRFKELFDIAKSEKNLTDEEKGIIRNLEHSFKYYTNVPKELIIEFSKETSLAFMAWNSAKQNNDFKSYLPHLKTIIRLCQLMADHLTYKKDRYDALLDLYEPGLTAERCNELFDEIKDPLSVLIKKITKSKRYNPEPKFVGKDLAFDKKQQENLSHYILKKIGYDFSSGRLDVSPHPFTIGMGAHDIRITTAYKDNDFRDSLTASVHEGGHALYEQGINPEYAHTPLAGGVSLGVHESQSRFWENQIGRHPEFIKFTTPLIHAFFPALEKSDSDKITMLFNHVKPGFIRIEADEVTYNLHIIIRFEIEHALINGKIEPEDLPEVWNTKMKKYLGVTPPTDTQGVLQDVHWSYGSFGYFPTYTLGNLYAAQLNDAIKKEIPYESQLASGNVREILAWLRQHIHQHGSVYTPDELIKKATGKKLTSKPYLNYITEKYTRLYGLDA